MNTNIDFNSVFRSLPGMAILLSPNAPEFTILDATYEVMKNSSFQLNEAIGKSVFTVFPDNPDNDNKSGRSKLRKALENVVANKKPELMELTRYDVMDHDGNFIESYWQPLNTPLFSNEGELMYILHTSENVTEKVQSEKKAKISDDNFKYFISQATAPLSILKGRDFVYTFANKANVTLLNNRPLVGKRLVDALPELKGGAFLSIMESVFDTGIPYNAAEVPFDAIFEGDSEPSRRFFDFNYIPYRNQEGQIEGLIVSCHDVTKQVEIRWNENQQLINKQAYNLFMQAPVGFSLTRGDEHILDLVNQTGLLLTGKTEDAIGKPIVEIFPEVESQGFIKILDDVKKKGETVTLQETPVTININGINQQRYFNIVYQPYYESSKIQGVLSISVDVTEQVKGRQNIEELKDRFENLADNLPTLCWIANSDGYIFWYNKRWYDYTGTTPEDMEGWGWKSVHAPDTLPDVLDKWQFSIITGKEFEMTFPIKGADGKFRPFLTRIVPIRNKDKEIIRWIGTNTEVAE